MDKLSIDVGFIKRDKSKPISYPYTKVKVKPSYYFLCSLFGLINCITGLIQFITLGVIRFNPLDYQNLSWTFIWKCYR